MANTTLTTDIIAKEATMILDNELVMGTKVNRGYEKEFANDVNGYKVGQSVGYRHPADFTVRSGAVMSTQDVVEGKGTITVDTQEGVDFEFTSQDLTLKIGDLSERVIKPAMVQLANSIDQKLHTLYSTVPNWVGTPGQEINAFGDFYKGVTRLNQGAVPMEGRCGVIGAIDHGALLGSQTELYNDTINKPAYREGNAGKVGGVDLYMTQNVTTHTVGAIAGTVKVDQALTTSTISYDDVKDSRTQTLHIDGLTSATAALKKGDVFTIAGVFDVNPVTKAKMPHLKQFTITADATAASNEVDLTIYPAMIWSGAFQNISTTVTDLNDQNITFMGTGGEGYEQNMLFHKNAFTLVTVPMVKPEGAVNVSRQTYKGLNVRVIPVYDGTNDVSKWRLDVLYGVKAVDPRLAVRLSGTA